MSVTTAVTDDVARKHRERVLARAAAANGSRGPASFVWGDFVTAPGTVVTGAAGIWAPRADGGAGLDVTASRKSWRQLTSSAAVGWTSD